jgi:DNA-binding NtrC family response regulator
VVELSGASPYPGPHEEISGDELPVGTTLQPAPASPRLEMGKWIRTLPAGVELRELLTQFEKSLIERALDQANGGQAKAPRMLGLSRSDLLATKSRNMRSDDRNID